ncbi:5-formyltetrahydrofolate cyclo-ligase [Plantactinospora sp. GCM10030261]|uniref:5-formyltetrahydrofolate cyclo-ligase n=1 Tax=Plantactinospora sp. GCM10030261 TaxID=3273420 RepID=UPI003609D2E9
MPDLSDEAEVAPEAKAALRRRVLARRRMLSAPDRAAAAGLVQRALTDLVRRLGPTRVAGYVPVGAEPGGPELPEVLRAALAGAGGLLLPVLRPDLDLDWAAYTGRDGLHAAGRGMREPVGDRLGVAAVTTAQVVVVPALAVDRTGVRLGRGGGSYDRALARLAPGALAVALLHDAELVDRVPALPHDRRVDAVITPGHGFRPLDG